MTELISEYTVDQKTAKIYKDDEGYFVELWENDSAIKQIDVRERSLPYAEDAADNWVNGLLKV